MIKSIYKKDTKGKIRMVTISTEGSMVIQKAGLLGGKKVAHSHICKPKNIGRANATTPEEQALFEANAKITKKLKEGYFETVDEAKDVKVVLPMLAAKFTDHSLKVDWTTAYVQPKLDGMRCLDTIKGKISRKNTPIETMDHIIVNRPKELTLSIDGELYAHGLNFQENMRLIKKLRPESINVKYHVYDAVSKLPFIDRYAILKAVVNNSENLELVPTFKISSFKEMTDYHKQFLNEGYEGTILRWGNEGYEINKRSMHLLKYKDFIDGAYEVANIEPSDKNPEQGTVICKLVSGELFGCGMKFSHKEREEILKNKENYIGQMAEVRFFEFSEDGIPRFPVCAGFRLDV